MRHDTKVKLYYNSKMSALGLPQQWGYLAAIPKVLIQRFSKDTVKWDCYTSLLLLKVLILILMYIYDKFPHIEMSLFTLKDEKQDCYI